mmetsp:Transcript_84892/g.240584  ORF Transcript_84892/g.240584 Transcript_84892/m.240584 type:complete len:123 (-) Transcript_84892:76-444(-)
MAARLLLALLAGPAAASVLHAKKCPPGTKVLYSVSADAAGTAEFVEASLAEGECNTVINDKITSVKLCGPGTFTLSRMSCNNHDYKAVVFTHSKEDYTTGCKTYSLADTNVAGYLGSLSYSC